MLSAVIISYFIQGEVVTGCGALPLSSTFRKVWYFLVVAGCGALPVSSTFRKVQYGPFAGTQAHSCWLLHWLSKFMSKLEQQSVRHLLVPSVPNYNSFDFILTLSLSLTARLIKKKMYKDSSI